MKSATTLKWHFPPTHGGPAQGFNDSGKEFFTADVMDHVVREIIQNSLDAKNHQYPDNPVVVRMSKLELKLSVFNAAELKGHISEALKATDEKKSEKGVRFYESALRMLEKAKIPVLKVVDENTTGLRGARWDSLVHEEGTTSKDNAAAGGSFGIGKNAPYAASMLGLVCYSTRYPNKHRVEKFIARCKIVAHQSPKEPKEKLQHVGFGTLEDFDGSNYPPVLGADIPESFRLQKTGTGIFIMGFKEERGWQKAVILSIVRNFFAAIHDKKLCVVVEDVEITNETLAEHFGKEPTKQYYDLYRNSEQPITVEVGGGGEREALEVPPEDKHRRRKYEEPCRVREQTRDADHRLQELLQESIRCEHKHGQVRRGCLGSRRHHGCNGSGDGATDPRVHRVQAHRGSGQARQDRETTPRHIG